MRLLRRSRRSPAPTDVREVEVTLGFMTLNNGRRIPVAFPKTPVSREDAEFVTQWLNARRNASAADLFAGLETHGKGGTERQV